jgi:ketosteroid isomerase-like protein
VYQDGVAVMGNLPEPGGALLERLAGAVNGHDLDALEGCFCTDYRNETPAHPARGFAGRDQVRRNWEQIFTFVPNITARVLRSCSDSDVVWSEWEMTGTRRDGTAHQMAGVILFGVRAGCFSWARFYLEPITTTPHERVSRQRRVHRLLERPFAWTKDADETLPASSARRLETALTHR